ncbi:ATP-binding protein [Candidatus Oscillochloris fontis]|uniref:ATP-binding protein n=1 Tax=Candidatus Oscillochloris fontis TaxID=2496868 RepID=UPI00101BDA13|nr:ATP-binding protein [Candidatus Oscillochloris fontis]
MSLQHPEVVRLDLPARYTYLHILSDCIADMLRQIDGIEDHEMLTYNMQLAAHEACTNIVGHAYAGSQSGNERIVISLALFPHPRRLQIELRDTGRSFDPEEVPTPTLDQAQVHGYGLFLMRNLMDSVTYTPQPGDNHWCLVKHL